MGDTRVCANTGYEWVNGFFFFWCFLVSGYHLVSPQRVGHNVATNPFTSLFSVYKGPSIWHLCARLVTQSCSTLVTLWTVARQAPLSMVVLQPRILEWIAMLSSSGSSQPRDRTHASCIAGGFFTI